jgi:uncharacterized membrane protein
MNPDPLSPSEPTLDLPTPVTPPAAVGSVAAPAGALVSPGASYGVPAWRRRTQGEHRWPAALAIIVAVGLQLALPQDLAFEPYWALPAVEVALFLVLLIFNPLRINRESKVLRFIAMSLTTVASVATAWSAVLLVERIVHGGATNAPELLLNGAVIWFTNVIVFALWYWEGDRGGPAARAAGRDPYPDFLFTGMTSPELVHPHWEPAFVDYFFLSFTNATAFSPTDTLPLSPSAKLTMAAQSVISLATAALVVARAVNIFG